MSDVVNRATKIAALNGLGATGAVGEAVAVILFSNVVTLTDSTVPADLDEVVIAGMEEQTAIDPGPAYDLGDGTIVLPYATSPFVATSLTGLPIQIEGWAILNTAKTAVLAAKNLDTPVPIDQVGDGLTIDARITWGN